MTLRAALHRGRHHRRGFSLLELILALGMIAILAATLYSAMWWATRAKRSTMREMELTRSGVIAADLVRQDFESVPPPSGILAREFVGLHVPGDAGGDADAVEFSSIGRDAQDLESPMSEGVRRVEYALRTDIQPPALVRRVTRNLLATSEAQVEEEILCRNVRSFSLRYFDGTTWQETWDSTTLDNNLPTAVAITLELANPLDPQSEVGGRSITRIVPLSCGRPLDELTTGGLQ